jgi:hypothetical protein
MDTDGKQFVGSLKFFGPSVEEGSIDIEKIGTSLVALNKLFKKCVPQDYSNCVSIKLEGVRKNCTELNLIFEQIAPLAQPVATGTAILLACRSIGLDELGRQFFGTVGSQLALKLFSKGKELDEVKTLPVNGEVCVLLRNLDGEMKTVAKREYELLTETAPHLKDFVQLESGREEEMKLGYYEGPVLKEISTIRVSEKECFQVAERPRFEDRLNEDFDESSARPERIVGKFIDYHGLAHKYHFTFQARKNQSETGKQKILCKVDESRVSEFIDLLKPEHQEENICIGGKATESPDGKIDKIIVEWFSKDVNYDPHQTKMF